MTAALCLLAIQGVIGAFDTLYYHEWRARLPARGRGAAAELARRGVASQLTAQQREKPATTPAEIAAPSTILGLNEAAALAGSPSDASSPSSLRLRLELGQLASIRDRINGAQIELATSQAAFKYRYNVTRPPQVPRRPSKPNGLAILIAGALGALLLAIASSAGADVLGGRIIEPWQMERQVGVPVLLRLGRL